ncbi:tetratricopeptide repeat protein, partial [Escherichia coli]
DVDNAAILDNLGGVSRDQGHYAEAERYYKRAFLIDETVLGKHHPYTATDMNNLAGLYRDQKRLHESAKLYQAALEVRTEVLGADNPLVAKTLI